MGEPFQFLHCADLHLGAAFAGLSRKLPSLSRLLADSPFLAWRKLVRTAIEKKVDFVIISGDVFDRAAPSLRGRMEFQQGLLRLQEAEIPVYLAAGNHDPYPAAWSDAVKLPENVHFFPADRVQCFSFEKNGSIAATIAGISFSSAEESRCLPLAVGAALADSPGVRIGVVHTDLSGDSRYAPAAEAQLKNCAADYWALGHIHQHQILCEKPLIVYPGTPQGRDINEPGPGGGFLVSADRSGTLTAAFQPVSELNFDRITLSASGVSDFDGLKKHLLSALAERKEEADQLIRLCWNGISAMDAELRKSDSDELYDYFSAAAAEKFPRVHLESVKIQTRGETSCENNALDEEIRLSSGELKNSEELEQIYTRMCAVRRELPLLDQAAFDAIRTEAAVLVSELLSGRLELTR